VRIKFQRLWSEFCSDKNTALQNIGTALQLGVLWVFLLEEFGVILIV